jgi:ATP-dependent DNA helicase RecG
MERDELLALLRGNEWDDVEAKESASGVSKSAYSTVSAFANTKGGWLLFGVAEAKGRLVVKGVNDPDRIQNDFLTSCRSTEKFSRPVSVHPHQHELDGKVVLAFFVEPSRRFDKPIRVRDGKGGGWATYIRLGAGDHRCTAEEEGRFLRDASTEPFDGALFCSYADDALEAESLRWFRGLYASRHEAQPLTELSDPLFLEELGLLREGQLTHAAALLFGKQKLIARLKPAGLVDFRLIRQPWSEEAPAHRFDDRLLCEGNLIQALRALIERLLSLVPNPFSLEGETMQRSVHPPEYKALREALVNLLVHQDYSDKHRLAQIVWYDDRTCFINPGDSFVTVGEMLSGSSTDLRNPLLTRLVRQIGFAEHAGTGLPTIVRTWREAARLPPEVVSDPGQKRFQLTLHWRVLPKEVDGFWKQLIGVSVSPDQARLLAWLEQTGGAEIGLARLASGLSASETRKLIAGLEVNGLVELLGEEGERLRLAPHIAELLSKARAPAEDVTSDDGGAEQVTGHATEQVTAHVAAHVTEQVVQLLRACQGEQSRADLMEAVGLTHREHFRETYLVPALAVGYLEMTIPDKPKSSRQKYRLTIAGQTFLNKLPTEQR